MKAALNGVLNLSILDGWWDECFAPAFGWAIPSAEERGIDPETRDAREAASILDLIEHELAPRFYERGAGLPHAWLEMIRHTLCELGPAAARDPHAARLRARAVPADGRLARAGRGRPLTRCHELVAEATIGAVPQEEAR